MNSTKIFSRQHKTSFLKFFLAVFEDSSCRKEKSRFEARRGNIYLILYAVRIIEEVMSFLCYFCSFFQVVYIYRVYVRFDLTLH